MLVPGANTPVKGGPQRVAIDYSPIAGAELDVSAFLLSTSGKVRGDSDMCFYGQPSVQGGAVEILSAAQGRSEFSVHLDRLDPQIEKVAFTATIHENRSTFASVSRLKLTLGDGVEADIPTSQMTETALILGEFYRRNGTWKFRCVGQGFNGGLEPLATHFGVDVAKPSPGAASTPAPSQPSSAVSGPGAETGTVALDTSRPTITLPHLTGSAGEIKATLNWRYEPTRAGGLVGSIKGEVKNRIDLNIGCFYEMQNGQKGFVQVTGNAYGSFPYEPFIALMGKASVGSSLDGEWIRINGEHWHSFRRITLFAFVKDGLPEWHAANAVLTLDIPGQPAVEVAIAEDGKSKPVLEIASMENVNGDVLITRKAVFHERQEDI